MAYPRKTIFVTLLRGALIRNLLRTGVVRRLLDADVRVVLLTPNFNDEELFKEFAHPNLIIEPLRVSKKRFQRFLEEVMRGAVFNRTVHFLYRYSIDGRHHPKRAFYAPRMLLVAPLRFVPGFKYFIRWVDLKINPENEHDYLFRKYKPDLVFNSASRGDQGVLKSAQRFGVLTVDMPKSWDNLSKNLFNVKADRLIVWSRFMKGQAIRLQGYKAEEIIVTGVPQFDFYARKDGLQSREEFFKKVGIDPRKKTILYTSSGGDVCDEAYFVELVREFIESGDLPDTNILVRPHVGYKNDVGRFSRLRGVKGVVIDMTDKQQSDKFKDNWDTSVGHVYHLVNSLYHADVVINVTSTMIFDATACGTPVINLRFDSSGSSKRHSVARYYGIDYVKAVQDSGATLVATNQDEYKDALRLVLAGGKKQTPATQNLIDKFLFKNDGKSAERLADALIKLAVT